MEEWKNSAIALKQRIEGINNWIKENPQVTEPNMYEYTQVLVECGEIYRQAGKYFDQIGYPTIRDEKGVERSADHYDLKWIPALKAIRDEIDTLAQLRNLNTKDEDVFTSVPCIEEFYRVLYEQAINGEYQLPENETARNQKKEMLCKTMGVSFYIWNTKRREPGYIYDNKTEFDSMKEMYNSYVESEGKTINVGDGNGNFTEYASLGKQIEDVFGYINDNYAYKEENNIEAEQTIDNSDNIVDDKWKNSAIALKQRVEGINNWIKENPQVTEPNMYEYTQVLVECGEIYRQACEYFEKNGYPTIKDESGNDKVADHSDTWCCTPELQDVAMKINELESLRNFSSPESFAQVPEVKVFLDELKYRAYSGEYDFLGDETARNVKKELMCKMMGVSYYIWNTKKNEPDYAYDNKDEYDMMYTMFDSYRKSAGVQSSLGDMNQNYNETQFGKQIEGIFGYIDKSYVYAEEDNKSKTI